MAKFHKSHEHDLLISLLRETRERAGISQNELSKRLGHRSNYMNRVEQGRRSLDVIGTIRILQSLEVDAEGFFKELLTRLPNA